METTVGVGEKRGGREEAEDLGLGFGSGSGSSPLPPQKLNRTADFPFRMVEPYLCPSSTSSPKSSSGPTFFYSGSTSDFYDGARVLQPFFTPFKSLDMGVGAGAGAALPLGVFPFTSAQWQELQRQALIYKHIMASVPVPHDLLFPISARSFPETPPFHLPPTLDGGGGGACFSLRLSNSTDPEPGRCRRTDGKKWRCSRDVAPDQKYCERHMHRGRPRSRKPVELRKTKPTPITNTTNTLATAVAIDQSALSKPFSSRSTGFLTKADLKFPFQSMEPNKEPRCLDWMNGGTEDMASNQQWELMHSNIRLRSDTAPVLQHYEDRLNLNYTDLNDHCCPFLNPNLSSIKENAVADHGEPPRRLIDAWSIENTTATTNPDDSSSVPTNDKLLPSTLTLSMSGGVEEGTDHIQMGLGLADTGIKSQPLNWIAPASPFGGPLAEVLQSSNMTSPHNSCSASSKNSYIDLINLMCKSCRGSHDLCPQDSPTRLVSSPSGVLQKALVSPSDSSSSSSPTFAAASRSEMAGQWMNHTK